VSGQAYTQPLTLRLDPRVKTSVAELEQAARLSREMYDGAVEAHAAYEAARAALASASGSRKDQLEALAPEPQQGRFRFFRPAPSGPPTLNGVSDEMMRAAMAMQEAETAPTARQVAACLEARTRYRDVMARWSALESRPDDSDGNP
jgi:hypothetical protein